jgi:SAM-dependent methyltransferase
MVQKPKLADVTIKPRRKPLMAEHTFQPDIETASVGYSQRFSGPVGEYFLQFQEKTVESMLERRKRQIHSVLDVGGGHGQLTSMLLREAQEVCVQGSDQRCFEQLLSCQQQDPTRLKFVVSPLSSLPFPDRSFDAVLAFRLLAHTANWPGFLTELCRVAKDLLIIDYASLCSFNVLTPVLFQIKKRIEGNTRPYFCHTLCSVKRVLHEAGYQVAAVEKQFFLPMGVHRAIANRSLSEKLERNFRAARLTHAFGSPVIVLARRDESGSS